MGWWENEKGNPVGDVPADYLKDMLKAIKNHADKNDTPMTLSQFLRHLLATLNSNTKLVSDAKRLPLKHVSAVLADKQRLEAEDSVTWDKTIAETMRQTFTTISEIFESTFDRLPTIDDLIANLEFVLSRPGDYFIVEPYPNDIALWNIETS